LKNLFKRQPRIEPETVLNAVNAYQTHLIAIARLAFIKPSTLVREAQNTKANAEYILELTKELEKAAKGAK